MSRCTRKPTICVSKNKGADQLCSNRFTAKLISAFVFATWTVQSLFFLKQKFQASSHLQCLYSPVCVGPSRKPKLLLFSRTGSNQFYPSESDEGLYGSSSSSSSRLSMSRSTSLSYPSFCFSATYKQCN